MNKDNWTTIVFALENYVNDLETANEFVQPHIYQTLWLACKELEK